MFALEPIVVSDLPKAVEFWSPVLNEMGYAPQHEFDNLLTFGKSSDSPNFSIAKGHTEIIDSSPILLQVESPKEVKAVYEKAVAVGGKSIKVDKGEGKADEDQSRATFLDFEGRTVKVYVAEKDKISWE